MKSLFPILALASFASVISAQAVPQVEAAAKEVKEKGGVEPPISSLARGLLDASGDLVVKAKDGKLEFEGSKKDAFSASFIITNPTARRSWTFPDGTGTVGLQSTATLAAAATVSFAPASSVSCYLLTPAQNETINAVKTGAVPGRSYFIRILTSGISSHTLTFGTNFKATGTLATGTADAKVFVVQFIYDGTNFNEVSRTAAM
ncbi:hypothetical protein [Verrucomicrobium spinosum]|uniref:hypothetical protein n=1 Tax=Verrucomicrobium spinosum TaxID=2736 RepID=UPI0001744C61|nr:hypothetical protein [Verrucomicrobium spinosum]